MDSLIFLERLERATPQPIYVLQGGEEFLKRQVLKAIRQIVLGGNDDGFALTSYPGDKATWAEVIGELQTLPFLAPRRLVVIEAADPFVSQERARLEKYFAEGAGKSAVTGVLVLDVGTWARTTKLAKMTPDPWLLACEAPSSQQLPPWCVSWCASRHGKQLAVGAAKLLVDLIGSEMGLLDKEMEKLAIYVGDADSIKSADVDQLVGRSRAENTWQIFNLIGGGKPAEALGFLGRLLDQGEEPMALLGMFSWQLRRLAQAARLNAQGLALGEALARAGIHSFRQHDAEQQMRHLGRRRLDQVYDWLLETDLGLKGGSTLPPSVLLERLVVRLARIRT